MPQAVSEWCSDAVPVKNTFVHFDDSMQGGACKSPAGRRRALRMCQSDPAEPMLPFLPVAKTPSVLLVETEQAENVRAVGGDRPHAPPIAADPMAAALSDQPPHKMQGITSSEASAVAVVDASRGHPFDVVPDQLEMLNTPEPSPRRWAEDKTPPKNSSALYALQDVSCWSSPVTPPWPPQQAHTTPLGQTPLTLALDAFLPTSPERPSERFPGLTCFNFTIRRADGFRLGLDLDCDSTGRILIVRKVLLGGAIEAWNRQCFDGDNTSQKAIWPGDAILRVNGWTDCEGMLQECRSSMLLRIVAARWDMGSIAQSGKGSMDPEYTDLGPLLESPRRTWCDRFVSDAILKDIERI